MVDRLAVKEAEALGDDELWRRLGSQVMGGGRARGDAQEPEEASWGRDWLERNFEAIRKAARQSGFIQAARSDKTLMVAELAALIAERWLDSSGALYAAVLIVRLFLDQLCGDGGDEPRDS